MDIVKRAYLKISEEIEGTMPDDEVIRFQQRVRDEVIRLIKVRAYSGRDWPRELGPYPEELRTRPRHKLHPVGFGFNTGDDESP